MPEPVITVRDLKNKLEADKSIPKHQPLLATFEEFLEVVDPEMEIRKLTRADWKRFLTHLEDGKRKLKPGTINHYLGRVSSALNRAGDYFSALSEWRPPSALWTSEPPGRERVLSNDEVSKLLAALRLPRQKFEQARSVAHRHEVYDLFRLMLLTAAREGELLALNTRAVSWDWRTVQIEATKTKTRRVIQLSATAFEILQARKIHAPRFFKKISHYGLYTALQRAGEVAEVEYGGIVDGGWIICDVRHLAATVMESGGVPYSAVAAILGHKRTDMTATYTHRWRRCAEASRSLKTIVEGLTAFLVLLKIRKAGQRPSSRRRQGKTLSLSTFTTVYRFGEKTVRFTFRKGACVSASTSTAITQGRVAANLRPQSHRSTPS
jgi:integrase